jgi:hypothetical protein
MEDIQHHADFVPSTCPSCGATDATVAARVTSGIMERRFLECCSCGQCVVTPWSDVSDLHSASALAEREIAA